MAEVFETLARIREQGVTILLVEQRAQRTVALADRTYVLANGELRTTARPGGRSGHGQARGGLPRRMIVAAVNAQTLIDATGLGAVYALMAVGIGLVFGVLRLVNFAYGQLIMVGAYTLAFTATWPVGGEHRRLLRRRRRTVDGDGPGRLPPAPGESPAVMLVTTFAIAFVLQAAGAARRHP